MTTPEAAPIGARVTTVVATRNRRAEVLATLPRHGGPVVLVDNASTDGTAQEVARLHPDVRVLALLENHGAAARNLGVELASTPYVAFADDDSWWAPGALERAVELLDAHPRLGLVAARILVGPDERLDPVCEVMSCAPLGRDPQLPGPRVLGFVACGAVLRRDAFLEVGGFDDVVFFFGEEERVALDLTAAGWDLSYVADVVAHHHPSPARDASRRQVLAARNEVLTAILRRPWPVVAGTAARLAAQGSAGRAGVREAIRRAPAALAARQRLPARVEVARRLLDTQPH